MQRSEESPASVVSRIGIGPLGMWCSIQSTYTTEIVARSGVDWLCLDTQHGFLAVADLLPMIQAAELGGTRCLVRVGGADAASIGRALDAGALGVVVPMINTAADAQRAVEACLYAPRGSRSWGPARLALSDPDYGSERANDRVLCIPMIETSEAVGNLGAILAVPGVRAILVGTSDLAVDLGERPRPGPIPGRHADAMRHIALACQEHGVVAGTNCGSREAASAFTQMGYELLAIANDATLLRLAANRVVADVRADAQLSTNDPQNVA
jgi:4-hydroxy-2-oxoheptanedioate aldolase